MVALAVMALAVLGSVVTVGFLTRMRFCGSPVAPAAPGCPRWDGPVSMLGWTRCLEEVAVLQVGRMRSLELVCSS